ncbi:MAG TPA: hypothetical protein P5048_04450 [Chlamydiales bacterium]|nr:hypothetical protein [Chlamydiales bacterium]
MSVITETKEKVEDKEMKIENTYTDKEFEGFIVEFDKQETIEEKIHLSINYLRNTLSQESSPNFKCFWEIKRKCLPLFKEPINPAARSTFWAQYIELSSEARRLKKLLDEQATFAFEQVLLAIEALESDLENYDKLLTKISRIDLAFPMNSIEDVDRYAVIQRELDLLNTFASRIHSLRKEVIKMSVRARQKNKLFQRLSKAGDHIFPKRKEYIKVISQQFSIDVDRFYDQFFKNEELDKSVSHKALKNEIKILQNFAKKISLNTRVFTSTRLSLSKAWERMKQLEKEYREMQVQRNEGRKENRDQVLEKIEAFSKRCIQGLTDEEVSQEISEILEFMKSVDLAREDVVMLKNKIEQAKDPILERQRLEKEERDRSREESRLARLKKIEEMKEEIINLQNNAKRYKLENLMSNLEEIEASIRELSLSKFEKQQIDRLVKPVKDLIDEHKQQQILNLSQDDQKQLAQLKEYLIETKQKRIEVKKQVEAYRKACNGVALDFEKAMTYRELVEEEKARLMKIDESIKELEEKIIQIEG